LEKVSSSARKILNPITNSIDIAIHFIVVIVVVGNDYGTVYLSRGRNRSCRKIRVALSHLYKQFIKFNLASQQFLLAQNWMNMGCN
jgi:hypothetical protein